MRRLLLPPALLLLSGCATRQARIRSAVDAGAPDLACELAEGETPPALRGAVDASADVRATLTPVPAAALDVPHAGYGDEWMWVVATVDGLPQHTDFTRISVSPPGYRPCTECDDRWVRHQRGRSGPAEAPPPPEAARPRRARRAGPLERLGRIVLAPAALPVAATLDALTLVGGDGSRPFAATRAYTGRGSLFKDSSPSRTRPGEPTSAAPDVALDDMVGDLTVSSSDPHLRTARCGAGRTCLAIRAVRRDADPQWADGRVTVTAVVSRPTFWKLPHGAPEDCRVTLDVTSAPEVAPLELPTPPSVDRGQARCSLTTDAGTREARRWLDAGGDPSLFCPALSLPLGVLVAMDDADAIRTFLDRGLPPDVPTYVYPQGQELPVVRKPSLLAQAAEEGSLEVLDLLLDAGAAPDGPAHLGVERPLDLALERGQVQAAVRLVQAGAGRTRPYGTPEVWTARPITASERGQALLAWVEHPDVPAPPGAVAAGLTRAVVRTWSEDAVRDHAGELSWEELGAVARATLDCTLPDHRMPGRAELVEALGGSVERTRSAGVLRVETAEGVAVRIGGQAAASVGTCPGLTPLVGLPVVASELLLGTPSRLGAEGRQWRTRQVTEAEGRITGVGQVWRDVGR